MIADIQTLLDSGTSGGLTDSELLGRYALAGQGEVAERAFAALVARHGPMVLRVCRSVLRDEHEAQDAFQATFLILVRRVGTIRKRDSLGSWLHGVALRVARVAKGASARRQAREGTAARASSFLISEDSDDAELARILHEEVGRLPGRYRAAVVLCYLEGQSCDAAAAQLGCRVGTVKSRLSRGRERLRGRLIRRGLAPSAVATAAVSPAVSAGAPPFLIASTVRAATSGANAGSVSAPVHFLMKGTLMMMRLSSWKTGVMVALGASVITVGASRLVRPALLNAAGPKSVEAGQGASAVADPADDEKKARRQAAWRLRSIALAMYNYNSEKNPNHLPPPSILSADGKPLLSWRVAILPYLGQKALFDKFRQDEPWDSPHNKPLLAQMPKEFTPDGKTNVPNATYDHVLVGEATLFGWETGTSLDAVKDGTSNTIMVVEGGEPTPWTKPQDIPFTPGKPLPKITGPLKGGFLASMADGSVHFVSDKAAEWTIEAAITINFGDVYNLQDLDPKTVDPAEDGGRDKDAK